MTFVVNDKQMTKFKRWNTEHVAAKHSNPVKHAAIGGRLTWSFTGTSLGQITTVTCACGEKIDLTDYEEW